VTVPVDDVPPGTVVGLRVSETSDAGVIVRAAFSVTPLRLAVITALVCALTPDVFTLKVALVCPAGIVTVPGTVAA